MNSLLSQRKKIDIYLLVGLIAIAASITGFYISQEQYFYFWDYTHYSDRVSQLGAKLHQSPLKALENFVDYLGDDYTQIPSLLLLPFSLLFGNSRLVFILSLVLVYLVPFCLMMGLLAISIFHAVARPRLIFWSTTYLALSIPSTWVSILRGYPDLGGAFIITLAILYYWHHSKLDQRKHLVRLAGLLAIAVWFRRPFAYSVRAFFVALLLEAIFDYFYLRKQTPKLAFQSLKTKIIQITKVGLWFLLFSPVLVFKILFIDYRTLYASYELTVYEGFQYYVSEFGFFVIAVSLGGYALGLIFLKSKYREFRFFFVLGIIVIAQWIFLAKQNASHYSTHFLSFFIIGLILVGFSLKRVLKSKPKALYSMITLGVFILLLNTILGLTTIGKENFNFRPLFAAAYPPLYRSDYETVGRMVNFFRSKTLENQFIYVAASSQTLTSDALLAAERQIYKNNQLKVLRTSNIDSRDVYPLNALMKSHFVVTAVPVQYHLKPDEQRVVKVAVDAVQPPWTLAQDFKVLPTAFTLENNTQVRIYERFQSTSFPTLVATLQQMRAFIGRQPGREPYWLSLQSEHPSTIERDIIRTVQLRDIPLLKNQPASFLYFGPISSSVSFKAKLNTRRCENPGEIMLRLSRINAQGKVLTSQEWLNTNSDEIRIGLTSLSPDTSYFRLDIQRSGNLSAHTLNQCSVEINNISLSG